MEKLDIASLTSTYLSHFCERSPRERAATVAAMAALFAAGFYIGGYLLGKVFYTPKQDPKFNRKVDAYFRNLGVKLHLNKLPYIHPDPSNPANDMRIYHTPLFTLLGRVTYGTFLSHRVQRADTELAAPQAYYNRFHKEQSLFRIFNRLPVEHTGSELLIDTGLYSSSEGTGLFHLLRPDHEGNLYITRTSGAGYGEAVILSQEEKKRLTANLIKQGLATRVNFYPSFQSFVKLAVISALFAAIVLPPTITS